MKEHYEVQNCLPDAIGPLSVCLSATLEYCGQTVGRIKTKLGLQVGLGHGHIVLDGAQPPLQKRGRTAPPPIFGPCLLWPNSRPSQLLLSTCYISREA